MIVDFGAELAAANAEGMHPLLNWDTGLAAEATARESGSRGSDKSQTFTIWSQPQETSCRPDGAKASAEIWPVWSRSVVTSCQLLTSQSLIVLSSPPLANTCTFGEKATAFTSPPWALRLVIFARVNVFQTRTARSLPPEAIIRESALNWIARTSPS